MKKKESLEVKLQQANYFIDYYTFRLLKSFKQQEKILNTAREVLKSNEKPNQELLNKVKKNQKKIKTYRANLKYLDNVRMQIEDEIEFSKYY